METAGLERTRNVIRSHLSPSVSWQWWKAKGFHFNGRAQWNYQSYRWRSQDRFEKWFLALRNEVSLGVDRIYRGQGEKNGPFLFDIIKKIKRK